MTLTAGQTIELTFTDTSLLGCGVACCGGIAVFCPGVLAGETALVRITEVKKKYAQAKPVQLLSASSDRIAPDCDAFGQCGGCVFRHVRYEAEAAIKDRAVRGALRRYTGGARIEPIVTAAPDAYRNKAVFHLAPDGSFGYYAAATHDIRFPRDGRCRLHAACMDEMARFTSGFLRGTAGVAEADFCALSIRQSTDGTCTAVLHARAANSSAQSFARLWANAVRCRFPQITGAFFGIGEPGNPSAQLSLLSGDPYLHDTFLSLKLRISPAAFYQVNHTVAEALCRTVADYAALQPGETAADLYCGTGILGMTLAAQTKSASVTGIEINPDAVRDAQANAAENQLSNIRFRCGDSASAGQEHKHFDCVVIDPPRRGCSPEMLRTLTRMAPERIVYVSCNPATLARDIAPLASEGYRLLRVRAHDMFPRTEHVETVCLLSKQ